MSKYFQKLEEGDSVAVVKEISVDSNFPSRLQGRTGRVKGKRGNFYVIGLKDQAKEKEYIIEAVHLKKIKRIESTK